MTKHVKDGQIVGMKKTMLSISVHFIFDQMHLQQSGKAILINFFHVVEPVFLGIGFRIVETYEL